MLEIRLRFLGRLNKYAGVALGVALLFNAEASLKGVLQLGVGVLDNSLLKDACHSSSFKSGKTALRDHPVFEFLDVASVAGGKTAFEVDAALGPTAKDPAKIFD